MKQIPKPLYPCKYCYEDYPWDAVELYWSDIEQDWLCDHCWDDRFSEDEIPRWVLTVIAVQEGE
jgi:hypothetical protein